nr:MAG TPA: Thermostable DNA ligase [Caudoviricetes sp.]
MDIFNDKSASPMLIAEMQEPFDSPDYIYELKLDGERCLAYLDKDGITLQNKRKLLLNPRFPELSDIYKSVKTRCILDGEITVLVDGKPDFSQVQRRALMSNKFKIQLTADKNPASFTAFDILYYKDGPVMDRPLMERKTLLQKVIKSENDRLAISRYIEEHGKALYAAAAKQGLEGAVAKRKDSLYQPGKRTKDWIKFKNLLDDDFVVLGYIEKENNVVSLVLGQYQKSKMIYKGHVTLGVSREDFKIISGTRTAKPPFAPPKGNENAVWIQPKLVCAVKFMERTSNGGLRQPVYKGLRDDKAPKDCIDI